MPKVYVHFISQHNLDKFIKKGIYRPHIPEKLRALNLAAMEMIDYVKKIIMKSH